MYVSRLGMRAPHANVRITCVGVTLMNVTGRAHELLAARGNAKRRNDYA